MLICQKCRNKRVQTETFVSISLPLSNKGLKPSGGDQAAESEAVSAAATSKQSLPPITLDQCLRHFTMPEALSDPVDCPSCGEKTTTTKQHVVSKLPPVLCLHLKRFDAAKNKKIEDFVSYPAKQLNMGPYLPHWYVRHPGMGARLLTTL